MRSCVRSVASSCSREPIRHCSTDPSWRNLATSPSTKAIASLTRHASSKAFHNSPLRDCCRPPVSTFIRHLLSPPPRFQQTSQGRAAQRYGHVIASSSSNAQRTGYTSFSKITAKTAPDPRICLLPRHARIAESALHFQPHRFSYTPYGYLQMDATHSGGRTYHRTQRNRGSVQRRI